MKFVKLIKRYMDAEDNVYEPDSVLEVSDDVADELIEAGRAEAHDGVVKEVKAEDIKGEIAAEVKSAMSEVIEEVKKEAPAPKVEVVEDAPVWKDASEFLMAVQKASMGKVDDRLYKQTGQNEGTNADGGFLVERRIANEIYQLTAQESILLPKCDVKEVGPNSNGIRINQVNESVRSATTLFGGVRVYSPAEAGTKTAFTQAYSQVDVPLGKYAAVNYITDELLADRVALRSFIAEDVGKAFSWVIDDDIINGTTNTSMIEIENHAATVQVTVAGNTPTAAELASMYAAMIPSSVNRAEWYMGPAQYAGVMAVEDTNGNALIQPNYTISPYGTLFGRPINVIEQAGALADDTSIMFLDLSQYLVIKRGGIEEAASIHVAFLADETAFRWVLRMGGTPKIASSITLPDTTVVSPFVTRN